MVLLDVVYNHFGPDGNYLGHYAPQFFTSRHKTPWGNAINFDDADCAVVRQFFIHNALYWLEEYHFDGLRLDAVHTIVDDSDPSFLRELAAAVHALPARPPSAPRARERSRTTRRCSTRDAAAPAARLHRAMERRFPSRAATCC